MIPHKIVFTNTLNRETKVAVFCCEVVNLLFPGGMVIVVESSSILRSSPWPVGMHLIILVGTYLA